MAEGSPKDMAEGNVAAGSREDRLESGPEPRPPGRVRRLVTAVGTAGAVAVAGVAAVAELTGDPRAPAGDVRPPPPTATSELPLERLGGSNVSGVFDLSAGRGVLLSVRPGNGQPPVLVQRGRVVEVRAGLLTLRSGSVATYGYAVTAQTTVAGVPPGVKSFAEGDLVTVTGQRRGDRLVAIQVTVTRRR